MKSWRTSAIIGALLPAVLLTTPASADVIVPEEWEGIWEIQVSSYDCDTNILLFSSTAYDTICSGWAFAGPEEEEVEFTCTGSADAGSYTQHCEGTMSPIPGCSMTLVFDATGTRTGETYTAVSTVSSTYVGDCMGIPDSCIRTEVTGTRIDTTPDPCTETANELLGWSALKSQYR